MNLLSRFFILRSFPEQSRHLLLLVFITASSYLTHSCSKYSRLILRLFNVALLSTVLILFFFSSFSPFLPSFLRVLFPLHYADAYVLLFIITPSALHIPLLLKGTPHLFLPSLLHPLLFCLFHNSFSSTWFLDAPSHLYKRSCPSVGPSVRRSVIFEGEKYAY